MSREASGFEDEYRLKGAILLNVIRFTQWPNDAFVTDDAPFVIAVVDDGAIRPAIEEIFAKEAVKGHPCRIVSVNGIDQESSAHVLFLPSGAVGAGESLQKLGGSPILTVSDAPGFCKSGGMVGLLLSNRKVRLYVNPEAVTGAGLAMSSNLLSIATLERDARGGESP